MKKGKGRNGKLLPSSLRIISSCIKTISTNASTAVRSASATVAASISNGDERKEQVLWAGFDKLELSPTVFRRVLLLGYLNGFQIFDVDDASTLSELVSLRDGAATFLQMLPFPGSGNSPGKYKSAHPMVVIAGIHGEEKITLFHHAGSGHAQHVSAESPHGRSCHSPTIVRFYSMKSNEYVKVISFKSAVLMVRCSSRTVAIGLAEQIYCFDTLTLEKKAIVVTYPVPQLGEPAAIGINTGYGPMAVGTRWLAYPPSRPFLVNTGIVSPSSLSAGASPSTSPGSGTMMARYAMESTKHLAVGLLTLGDMGYKKLSKHYPELLPDSLGCMASEPENAGVVAVKDLVSSEVVSQFRAHESPISALCFDPSGTLLVTASTHGKNINVFRIMPCHKCSEPRCGEWNNSYVHLYKLHRGVTSAMIQDICFSQYSQWIAIVTTRATAHIFVLSPFGSNDALQTLHAHVQGNSQYLVSSSPWWSAPSFSVSEQHALPPPTCTLSVVTRMQCSNSGLLNSVSNAAATVAGKIWTPSGAVAAVFHNSNSSGVEVRSNCRTLEHILVYTPTGFVVQHELKVAIGSEVTDGTAECLVAPVSGIETDELRVKVEPLQWWDVCRRFDNMEREESFSACIFDELHVLQNHDDSRTAIKVIGSAGEKKIANFNSLNFPEKSHLYLSNAEVQIKSCRLPIWQKTTVRFHVLETPHTGYDFDGEFEIEMASSHEVEIRHKDLLPVFENFLRMQPGSIASFIPSERKHSTASTNCCQTKPKANEASIIYHSKPSSCSSTESSEEGSSGRSETSLDLDHFTSERSSTDTNHMCFGENHVSKVSRKDHGENSSSPENGIPPLNPDSDHKVDFGRLCEEGYWNSLTFHNNNHSETASNEIDTNANTHQVENCKDEVWIGGMFDLSKEG